MSNERFSTASIRVRVVSTVACMLLIVAGCGREFGETPKPRIEVFSPDLSAVVSERETEFRIRIVTPRTIERAFLDGQELAYNSSEDLWSRNIVLERGLNTLLLETYLENEPVTSDTLQAFRMSLSIHNVAQQIMPFPVGGHTLTRLENGEYVLIGGASKAAGPATREASRWRSGEARFVPYDASMEEPRVGHTATKLPDGRLLIVGGAVVGDISDVGQLNERVEILDPASGTFLQIPVVGDPIRRMDHTASVRNIDDEVYIDLLGGRGDVQYDPPRIDIRRDLRTFQLRGDTLYALSPAVGPFIARVAGHRQTPLSFGLIGQNRVYHVTGMRIDNELTPLGFRMDFDSPVGIDVQERTPPLTGRLQHADVLIQTGLIALIGGRGASADSLISDIEFYVEDADSYFALDMTGRADFPSRYAHTTAPFGTDSMLILGGFDSSGDAIRAPVVLQVNP